MPTKNHTGNIGLKDEFNDIHFIPSEHLEWRRKIIKFCNGLILFGIIYTISIVAILLITDGGF